MKQFIIIQFRQGRGIILWQLPAVDTNTAKLTLGQQPTYQKGDYFEIVNSYRME